MRSNGLAYSSGNPEAPVEKAGIQGHAAVKRGPLIELHVTVRSRRALRPPATVIFSTLLFSSSLAVLSHRVAAVSSRWRGT